jgi:hypothetical protein
MNMGKYCTVVQVIKFLDYARTDSHSLHNAICWSIHYEVSTRDLLVRVKTLHDDLVRDILYLY